MGLFDKVKERRKYWEDKIYKAKEKNLTERIERAEERKIKRDKINALELKLKRLEPKRSGKNKFGVVANAFFKNAQANLQGTKRKKNKGFI